ncbi:helix-turn-helix transcriptional regulator [Chachezhania antarctica]|uniref:helix-turn-helix transcriptional regulator n=1 Tax=Chachezhania antarctica TaxID=2340860 RepID=UPI000EAE1D38|nr:helix-turn-helix transcriptional regulator [Chachezhania antarctica]|tara:strand:+ start:12429 stop:13220 length:792 start_codon:yes stop_codon:yes gene_type:complete
MQPLPNTAERHLADVIGALGTDDFAHALYAWLDRSIEIDNTTMLAYFQTRRPEALFYRARVSAVHANIESNYISGAYLLDPFHELHVARVPEGLYRLRDFAPDQFQRNEYYATYYRRTTLVDEMAYVAYPAEGVSVHVCLGRDASSGRPFSPRDVDVAQRLSTIACRLIAKQWAGLSSSGDYTDAKLVDRLRERFVERHGISLSRRQSEVALLILRGHSSVSIGLRLEISPQTVKVFRKQLYRKCRISSQAELFSLVMPLLSD